MMSTEVSIADIGRFFDRLVDLIPPKHYFDAGEAINLKYLKRTERDNAKASFKEQHKQNKKRRLDPDAAQTTTRIQQERAANGDEPSTSNAEPPSAVRANLSSSASREELQERLQAKVAAMRQQRNVDERAKAAKSAKEWRKAKLKEGGGPGTSKGTKRPAKGDDTAPAAKHQKTDPAAAATPEDPPTFVFNNLRVTDGDRKNKKGKPKSKQQMLREAEDRQAEAEELVKTSEGKAKLKEEAWKKLMKLAQGEKILDNPQLLRRSIKKEGKLKAKKAELWATRADAVKEKQAKTQQKRHDNLQKRVDEKKAKKVAKREKKLLRAGFEGRKDTFIK